MLTLLENIVVVVVVLSGCLLFMPALNRVWPREKRRVHNDLIGWQAGILGTTYAVILGFMLYTVWTAFIDANLNVDLEANALRNMFRLSEGLPQQQRAELEDEIRSYADTVIERDWPAMAAGETPEHSHVINERMWKTLMSVKTASPAEILAEDHALTELSTLTFHRRTRLIQAAAHFPVIFWWVLIVGGLLTIFAASTFGSENSVLHAIQVFSLTLLITLVLLAIADVNLPFRGWVHISNYAFVRARENMTNP
jgi:Protein of unknown function (DUF4239)